MALDGPRVPPAHGDATHLAVLVHGYGADGRDLIGLAPHFQRLLPTTAFVAPNAPTPMAEGRGFEWFAFSKPDRQEIQKGVVAAAPILDAFLDAELERLRLGRDRLMLIGFSQGAMLCLAIALARPCAAILGFSGLLGSPLTQLGPETTPILIVHGDSDSAIPVDAMFYSASAMATAGARVQWHISPGMGHGIAPDGLAVGIDFLGLAASGQLSAAGSVHCPLASAKRVQA